LAGAADTAATWTIAKETIEVAAVADALNENAGSKGAGARNEAIVIAAGAGLAVTRARRAQERFALPERDPAPESANQYKPHYHDNCSALLRHVGLSLCARNTRFFPASRR
jgi:hypothetical protein